MGRFYHLRAPLLVKQVVGNKEVMPAVIPDYTNPNGGATILIEDHDDEYVKVKVAWCRWSDPYCRKIGRTTAESKEPTLVKRIDLKDELEAIDAAMLEASCWPLRHQQELMNDCMTNWINVAQRFSKAPNAQANQGQSQ